jgi:hypothetical protein
MNKKKSSSEPRTDPRTEPTITPVRCEWEEDKSPPTGTAELVEDGGADDEVEVGTVIEVIGGESGVKVEGSVGDVVEGAAAVEEGIAGAEEGVAGEEEGFAGEEEGIAEVEDVGADVEWVGEEVVDDDGDGAGEDNPP